MQLTVPTSSPLLRSLKTPLHLRARSDSIKGLQGPFYILNAHTYRHVHVYMCEYYTMLRILMCVNAHNESLYTYRDFFSS